MKSTFQQKLDEELLNSEKRRTAILIGIFMFAMVFRYVADHFFSISEETMTVKNFKTLWLFPLSILVFEFLSWLYISKKIKRGNRKVPLLAQYLNSAFEIAIPSIIILIVSNQNPEYNVLKSPAILIYFIFIVLSTLRLNFGLSLFCGLMSGLSYSAFSIMLYRQFFADDLARSVILIFCGIAAGLVARQIRAGINNSLKEAERRHKVESLFGQQISMEVAEKMLASDGKIESRRMHVAIMFIDIRNFTKFAADRNPEDIVQYQNSFFRLVINTVTKHQGIVHQFLGDGCMVIFGAPVHLENPAQHAVNASVELLEVIESATNRSDLVSTKIGIGIHTGEAVTGNIGTEERQQYSITGNVVILASRIEQLNKQFGSQLLISADVFESINYDAKHATSFGHIALKGWHTPVSIYKLA